MHRKYNHFNCDNNNHRKTQSGDSLDRHERIFKGPNPYIRRRKETVGACSVVGNREDHVLVSRPNFTVRRGRSVVREKTYMRQQKLKLNDNRNSGRMELKNVGVPLSERSGQEGIVGDSTHVGKISVTKNCHTGERKNSPRVAEKQPRNFHLTKTYDNVLRAGLDQPDEKPQTIVSRRIKVKDLVSDETIKAFSKLYPGVLIEGGSGSFHPHPLGAYGRILSEEIVFETITRDFGENVLVTDIGGNAKRHSARNRKVHCCNPYLDTRDVGRYAEHTYKYVNQDMVTYCHNKSQDCNIIPDVYIAIHSLYYLTRDDILSLIFKSNNRALYAVVHVFREISGSFHSGESKYQILVGSDKKPTVHMRVNGNDGEYSHDPLFWLTSGYYSSNGRAIAWTTKQLNVTGDTVLVKFLEAPLGMKTEVSKNLTLIQSISNLEHCGAVLGVRSFVDQHKFTPSLTIEEFKFNEIISWNFMLSVEVEVETRPPHTVIIPKSIVAEAAAAIVGVERNSATLKNVIRHIGRMIKDNKMDMPADMILDCSIYGAALAYIYKLEEQIDVFNSLSSEKKLNNYGKLKDAMLFNHSGISGIKKFLIFARNRKFLLASMAISACLALRNRHIFGYKQVSYVSRAILSIGNRTHGLVTQNYSYRQICVAGCLLLLAPMKPVYDYVKPRVDKYKENISNVVSDFQSAYAYGTILQCPNFIYYGKLGTVACLTKLKNIRAGATFKRGKDDGKGNRDIMSLSTPAIGDFIPVVPASTVANEERAVVNRGLMEVPTPKEEAWTGLFNYVRSYSNKEEDVVLPTFTVEGVDFQKWNDNPSFTQARKAEHVMAYESLKQKRIDRKDCIRKSFIKQELTLKNDGGEIPAFDPRLIQGTSARANVCLGPWMANYAKELCKIWSVRNSICYTSGCSAEVLGDWRLQYSTDNVTIFEIDYSRFDAHQGQHCHDLEALYYRRAGLNNHASADFVFKQQNHTIGYLPRGTSYVVENTRKSGDPNTSCGNSIINGSLTKYIFSKNGIEGKMLVQGDDNLFVTRQVFSLSEMKNLEELIKNEYLKFGFVITLRVTSDWSKAEFCSKVFWPVAPVSVTNSQGKEIYYRPESYILGPKIGRALAKVGWSLKDLNPDQVYGKIAGMMADFSAIPVLRTYVQMVFQILAKHGHKFDPELAQKYVERNPYSIHCSLHHTVDHRTSQFFNDRYGLDLLDTEDSLQLHMLAITDLKTIFCINETWLNDMLEVDNVI